MAIVVGEMDTVNERIVLCFSVGVVKSHDHGSSTLAAGRVPPSADTAQEVNCLGGDAALQLDGVRHFWRHRSTVAVQHNNVADAPALRIDRIKGNAIDVLHAP